MQCSITLVPDLWEDKKACLQSADWLHLSLCQICCQHVVSQVSFLSWYQMSLLRQSVIGPLSSQLKSVTTNSQWFVLKKALDFPQRRQDYIQDWVPMLVSNHKVLRIWYDKHDDTLRALVYSENNEFFAHKFPSERARMLQNYVPYTTVGCVQNSCTHSNGGSWSVCVGDKVVHAIQVAFRFFYHSANIHFMWQLLQVQTLVK